MLKKLIMIMVELIVIGAIGSTAQDRTDNSNNSKDKTSNTVVVEDRNDSDTIAGESVNVKDDS